MKSNKSCAHFFIFLRFSSPPPFPKAELRAPSGRSSGVRDPPARSLVRRFLHFTAFRCRPPHHRLRRPPRGSLPLLSPPLCKGVSRALCASPRCGVRARRTEVFAIVGKNRDRWRRRSLRRRDRGRRLKRADGRVVVPARQQPLQPSRLAPLGTLPNRAPAKRRSIFVGFSQGGQGVDIITRPQFSSVHRQILS